MLPVDQLDCGSRGLTEREELARTILIYLNKLFKTNEMVWEKF